MRIVLASSEAVPFAKTGGLADVASALAKALDDNGHDVSLVLPYYPQSNSTKNTSVEQTGETVDVEVGTKTVSGNLLRSKLPESGVDVILVDQPAYFDRPGLYNAEGKDYVDNCERFVFFSRAVLEVVRTLRWQPDIIHANDWQTGLVPALLQAEYRQLPEFERTASVITVHNLAFQGNFWHWDMLLTGLDWKYFNWRQMEYFGQLSLLKTGIVFADMVTTVSPTYAEEIQTEEFGCGFQGVLHTHREKLVGILNGIDPKIWNPATDAVIEKNYTFETMTEGKALCKQALQKQLGLPVRNDVPLIGMISRMTDQKGFDLMAACADELLQLDFQLAILGTGDEKYEKMLTDFCRRSPEKVAAVIGFDETLAHQIEAGADLYLMPSKFEPCGLNQMYSLAYGTVPIVRAVGGLADSVVDATSENLEAGTANGFCFQKYDDRELIKQIRRAIEMYQDKPAWMKLIRTGMKRDWSWKRSAADYLSVYKRALSSLQTVEVSSTSV